MSTPFKAFQLAALAHRGQTWSDGRPYTDHLGEVTDVLWQYRESDLKYLTTEEFKTLRIAAYLHDTLEDTPLIPEIIENEFGLEVLELVQAVTNEPGKNRKERHEKTYPKTRAHPLGTALKLSDRIANVRESDRTQSRHLGMYRKEHDGFKNSLYVPEQYEGMWAELERLLK